MRLLIVGPSNRFQSGISTYTIRLANALADRGHEVSVVAFRKLLPQFLFPGSKRVGQNLSALTFRDDVAVFDEMDYNDPTSWRAATAFLEAQRPDAVLLQWWTSSAAHMHLRIKRAAERLGIPVYVELHEVVDTLEQRIWPIAKYARVMGPRVIRGNAGYITHSESDKGLVCAAYGLDPAKVSVIPHGNYDHFGPALDRSEARAALGVREPCVLLYFGLIREYKGIPLLIKAFEAVPEQERRHARLLIVGEVWEGKAALMEQLAASPARDRITLVDEYVSDAEVSKYFSASDALILPYTRASQSGVAHIGISYGKPLIVTRVGGLVEALQDYGGCSFVEPNDAQALAAPILERIRNRVVSVPITAPPKKSSWERVAAQYGEVLAVRRA